MSTVSASVNHGIEDFFGTNSSCSRSSDGNSVSSRRCRARPCRCPAPTTASTWRPARGGFAQARGHVAIAFGDDRFVERRRLRGEFAEGRLEHVAFLEFFDLGFVDFVVRDHAGDESCADLRASPPAEPAHRAAEGEADIAIDEVQRQAKRLGFHRGDLEFRARFDAELFGEPALVAGEGEVGREHGRLAFAQHLDQVELRQRVRIGQPLQALRIEFDGDFVVGAAGDRGAYRIDAGLRNMRGTEQGVADAVALDDRGRLVGEGMRRRGFGSHQDRRLPEKTAADGNGPAA